MTGSVCHSSTLFNSRISCLACRCSSCLFCHAHATVPVGRSYECQSPALFRSFWIFGQHHTKVIQAATIAIPTAQTWPVCGSNHLCIQSSGMVSTFIVPVLRLAACLRCPSSSNQEGPQQALPKRYAFRRPCSLKLPVSGESIPKQRRNGEPFLSTGSFPPLALALSADQNGAGKAHCCVLPVVRLSVMPFIFISILEVPPPQAQFDPFPLHNKGTSIGKAVWERRHPARTRSISLPV